MTFGENITWHILDKTQLTLLNTYRLCRLVTPFSHPNMALIVSTFHIFTLLTPLFTFLSNILEIVDSVIQFLLSESYFWINIIL